MTSHALKKAAAERVPMARQERERESARERARERERERERESEREKAAARCIPMARRGVLGGGGLIVFSRQKCVAQRALDAVRAMLWRRMLVTATWEGVRARPPPLAFDLCVQHLRVMWVCLCVCLCAC
jgi:hypothetical protein